MRPYVASDGKYADLAPLNDKLSPENDIVFVGINPGVTSAERGHHYAGPTNVSLRARLSAAVGRAC